MRDDVNPIAELDAMKKVAEAMDGLSEQSIRRILGWASDMFGVKSSELIPKKGASAIDDSGSSAAAKEHDGIEFEEFAEMYAAASPNSDAEKALVASYWLQYQEGRNSIDTQKVNTMLKHMGHGIGNITRAFDNLVKTKPQLVVQLRKAGSSKQARKTFKVTHEGKKCVEAMMARMAG